MFTGITRGTVSVLAVEARPFGVEYVVDLGAQLSEGLELGASVSLDGVCQTVAALDGSRVHFHVIHETLRVTTLNELRPGIKLSVERSLRAGDEIGGHEVSGHVTGTGDIAQITLEGEGPTASRRIRVKVPSVWMRALLPRGFVAVDGSSLTVAATGPDWFEVCLIPETMRLTNLGQKDAGEKVNIELDARTLAIVATVERVLASYQASGVLTATSEQLGVQSGRSV